MGLIEGMGAALPIIYGSARGGCGKGGGDGAGGGESESALALLMAAVYGL